MSKPLTRATCLIILLDGCVSRATCAAEPNSSTTRRAAATTRRANRGFEADVPRLSEEARIAFADSSKTAGGKIGWLRTIADPTHFRELRPDVERLAREDPSPEVRKCARDVLAFWHRIDSEKAAAKARADATLWRAEMTSEQRRQADAEANRRAALKTMDAHVKLLMEGTDEQRRMVGSSANIWAEHLPEVWPVLREVVRADPNPSVRAQTLVSLLLLLRESGGSVPLAESLLDKQNDRPLRRIAATHLCSLGHKEGIPVLLELASSSKDTRTQADLMSVVRSTARVDAPELNPGKVLSKRWKDVTEEDRPLLAEAIAAWKKWWEREGERFVPPRARATNQPASRPAANR